MARLTAWPRLPRALLTTKSVASLLRLSAARVSLAAALRRMTAGRQGLPDELEGARALEGGQAAVGQDDVGLKIPEPVAEIVAGLDPGADEAHARLPEFLPQSSVSASEPARRRILTSLEESSIAAILHESLMEPPKSSPQENGFEGF